MSEPARHDDAWGKVPPSEQENRKAGGPDSEATPPLTRVLPDRELPEQATPGQVGEWPIRSTAPVRNEPADRAGYALGAAAGRARQLGVRLQDQVHDRIDDLRSRFKVIRGRASEEVQETAGEVKHDARQNLNQLRSRAQYLAHEYPIQFVLGAAASAFAIGFLLGWWRQSE
jgi:hypothetical protein